MRLFRLIFCVLMAALTSALPAVAQTSQRTATKPGGPARGDMQLTRTVRTFDFEEFDLGNVEDTPMGWVKVEGSGMPHYLKGQFDRSIARSGRTSFRMDLNGGSIGFRYPANRIFAIEGAIYRVETHVRTTSLRNARARLTAYFCDIDGRPMPSTIHTADLDPNLGGDEQFHPLRLELTAASEAASLVVEIAVLQPALRSDDALGGRELTVEDIEGSAWFDDVKITQVPEVLLSTDRNTNVFYHGEPINLRLRLQDQLTTDLTAELRVFDIDGKPMFQRTGGIAFTPSTKPRELLGTIPLPTFEAGWYRAALSIRSGDTPISQHVLQFVQLGDSAGAPMADDRFGVVATSLPPQAWDVLPDAMDQLAAGRLKLSVWTHTAAVDSGEATAFDHLLSRLAHRGVSITACLAGLPPDIAQRVGSARWIDLLNTPTDRWQPQLAYLVSGHANHLSNWQLFEDDQAEQIARDPKLRAVFARFLGEFKLLVDDPDLSIPWPAWVEMEEGTAPSVALSVPGEILPEQLPLYIADIKSRGGQHVSLTLEPIDREKYGRAAQERDLALRIGFALAGGADRIDLPLLLDATTARGETIAQPDPLFMVQRTVTTMLSGARCLGKVPITEDVDAILFEREGRGIMLVWARGDAHETQPKRVSLALGKSPVRIDLLGRAMPIPKSLEDRRRPDDFDLIVGTQPVFITDVDPGLLALRAAVRLDNPLLESTFTTHGRKLLIRNTFDTPISGSIRLRGPSGWTLTLGATNFSLNPGETLEAPLTLDFPLSTSAGTKVLHAELNIQGNKDYRTTVPINLKLGLSDIGLQTIALRRGKEIVVQQMVTNYSSAPVNYNAFVTLPGQARQERLLTNLGPGKTMIRKYRFAAPELQTTRLRSGVREMQGRRMLNEEVTIE